MSILDHLKDQSQRQRVGAVGPDARSSDLSSPISESLGDESAPGAATDPPEKSAAASEGIAVSAAYYADWIERLENARTLLPTEAEAFLKNALQQAPADDARIFALAGGSVLLFQDVANWLKLRKALQEETGRIASGEVPPEVARHWLRQLGPPGSRGAVEWADHCRRVADAAEPVGMGLDPLLVAGLQAHPDWARAYLQCGSAKARLGKAHLWVKAGAKPEPKTGKGSHEIPSMGNAEPKNREPANRAATVDLPSHPAPDGSATRKDAIPPPASPPFPSGIPPGTPFATGVAPGTGVGLALGGLAGGFVGGVVGGLKAAVTQAFSKAARVTTAPSPAADGLCEPEPLSRSLVADAESALATLAQAAHHLQRHPTLAVFWRVVDQQAHTRFAGDRAAMFQDLAGRPTHPLRAMFERQRCADPDVARRYEQAQAAFERLQVAWTACARAHQNAGRWAPSPEQLQTLRAACRQVPPGSDRPALIEQVEHLLQALASIVRQAFHRDCAPARSPSTAPAP
jgi:hypothetical protein